MMWLKQYGADSLRLYEMFMGPLDVIKPWTDTGVKGVYGFPEPGMHGFLAIPQTLLPGKKTWKY